MKIQTWQGLTLPHVLTLALTLSFGALAAAPVAIPRVVLGTTQMDGVAAHLGETFTLGQQSPLNFTLTRAEYSLGRVVLGNTVYFPKAGEKLLALHFTVHNPQKRDVRYYWADLNFTAVDAQDRNHVFAQAVVRDGTTERLEINLKPAQKVQVMTVIRVPAAGVVPKLLVQRESALLRYDLRGQVTRLPAALADPTDPDGATAATQIRSTPGSFVPLEAFDVRLDEAKWTEEVLNGKAPRAGRRFLVAVFTVKNPLASGQSYAWSDFKPTLRDADGERVEYNGVMLKASRDEHAGGRLPGGEETRVRFFFELPANVGVDSLSITDSAGRLYGYDLKDVK